MTDIERAVMSTMIEPIKALNAHIEALENDTRYCDPIFGEDHGVAERDEWVGELKRERAGWIEDLQRAFGSHSHFSCGSHPTDEAWGIRPSKPWPRR